MAVHDSLFVGRDMVQGAAVMRVGEGNERAEAHDAVPADVDLPGERTVAVDRSARAAFLAAELCCSGCCSVLMVHLIVRREWVLRDVVDGVLQ